MRRGGRILIVLVIIVVLIGLAAVFFLNGGIPGLSGGASKATPTQQWVAVVSLAQPVARGDEITAEVLSTTDYPPGKVTEVMVTNKEEVLGKFAKYPLAQGMNLTIDMVEDRAGLSQIGSDAAKVIPPGMTAITIPISRLTAAGFSIQDGDHIDVIATMLFVDVDPSYQTALPNWTSTVVAEGYPEKEAPLLTANASTTNKLDQLSFQQQILGRTEIDQVLNHAFYVIPNMAESQRPRLVSQMILQNIQVLHIGDFQLAKEDTVQQQAQQAQGQAQPTQQSQTQQQAQAAAQQQAVKKPDIITLIVTPQDAVTLTYLIYHNANLTLTLRGPEDESKVDTEAATLQYLLSQYVIPVPARYPYAITPALSAIITTPILPNDIVVDTGKK